MVIWGRHRGGNEPDLLEFGLTLNLGSSYQPLGWFSRGIPLIGEEMPGKIKMGKISPKPKPGYGINPPKPGDAIVRTQPMPGKKKPGLGINPPKKRGGGY